MRHCSYRVLTLFADAYIIGCSLIAFLILGCFGNLPAIDAFFFAVSGSTESGLNTVDVKDLKLAQQLVIYFFPILTNLATVNILVVVIRIWYFEKRFREISGSSLCSIVSSPSHLCLARSTCFEGPQDAQNLFRRCVKGCGIARRTCQQFR